MSTKAEVFIIESLSFADERADRFEGQIVKRILALSGKRCEYYYIRTERELRRVLKLFTKSGYRYLHLSCHANRSTMATTLDNISFPALSSIIGPHLANRRLFLSACSMTNELLAKHLMPESRCFSILGPDQDIAFADATILWASLYHVMFAADTASMKGMLLRSKAQEVSNMYRVHLRFFTRDESKANGYTSVRIAPKQESPA